MVLELSASELALREARADVADRHMVWILARDRETGKRVGVGFWPGVEDATLTVGSETRTYIGCGTLLDTDPVESAVGLDVRTWRASLNDLTPEVVQLFRGYDVRFAPIEVHLSVHDPVTRERVALRRIFRGWVDKPEIIEPPAGGAGSATIECASAFRALTRTVPHVKSDAAMRLRNPDDRFGEYRAVVGEWETRWGTKGGAGGGGGNGPFPRIPRP